MRHAILAIAMLAATNAAADPDTSLGKLGEARAAFDAVHYPDAQRLLGEALDAGGNSPAETAEIYRLSAATAAALGHAEIAEQFYRRWLAIDPHASLVAGDSPKLQEPFAAARAYIQAHGGLVVRVERRGTELDVSLVADALAMATSARRGGDPPVAFGSDRHAHLADADRADVAAPVVIDDDHGNHLVELTAPARPIQPDAPGPPVPAPPAPSDNWRYWAVASGLVIAASAAFGIAAITYNTQIQDTVDHSGAHFASDVSDQKDRTRLFTYLCAGTGAVGIGLAIPAIVLYPKGLRAMIAPGGLAVSGSF